MVITNRLATVFLMKASLWFASCSGFEVVTNLIRMCGVAWWPDKGAVLLTVHKGNSIVYITFFIFSTLQQQRYWWLMPLGSWKVLMIQKLTLLCIWVSHRQKSFAIHRTKLSLYSRGEYPIIALRSPIYLIWIDTILTTEFSSGLTYHVFFIKESS